MQTSARAGATDLTRRIEDIIGRLIMVGSHHRLASMLNELVSEAPVVAWPVLLDLLSGCDDTWAYRRELLRLLRSLNSCCSAREFMTAEI